MSLTIYDISEKAGVSIATVSRVLNNSNNVSEKTRQKVLDVMEANGYTPNVFARGLGLDTMKTIGILCADSSDLYLAKVFCDRIPMIPSSAVPAMNRNIRRKVWNFFYLSVWTVLSSAAPTFYMRKMKTTNTSDRQPNNSL